MIMSMCECDNRWSCWLTCIYLAGTANILREIREIFQCINVIAVTVLNLGRNICRGLLLYENILFHMYSNGGSFEQQGRLRRIRLVNLT